jgi:PLP dependent protein
MTTIANNFKQIRTKIAAAAHGAGRDAAAITLVAVSKTHAVTAVAQALAIGQRVFGENRVQEAAAKFPALRAANPDLRLHLIGPLQTNKAEEACGLFDVIETLDRPRLAEILAKIHTQTGQCPELYVQVNSGNEPQKVGVAPDHADDFIRRCRDDLCLPVTGVMCIPPIDQDPTGYFRELAAIATRHQLANISMGMSGDFETAIACGATTIRIGSALFGERAAIKS